MKLPFFWTAFGFSLGLLLEYFFEVPVAFIAGLLPLFFLGMWLGRGRAFFLLPLILVFAVLGSASLKFSRMRPVNAVEQMATGDKTALVGRVKTQPEISKQGRKVKVSFILASQTVLETGSVDSRLRGNDRGVRGNDSRDCFGRLGRCLAMTVQGDVQVFLFNPRERPARGDVVRLWGELKRPEPPSNPGQFNYRDYLSLRQIYAVLSGFGWPSVRILERSRMPFWQKVPDWLRSRMSERIDSFFDDKTAVLLEALILGKRRGLSPAVRDDFMKTGVSHISPTASRKKSYSAITGPVAIYKIL